jgi:hypothetical protein
MKTVLVTGDMVQECHLYGGVKAAATSFSEPGTRYTECLGGAALTNELVGAAADAKGLAWDAAMKAWEEENGERRKKDKHPLPRPSDLEALRTTPSYGHHLDLDTAKFQRELRQHPYLRSYGVWLAKPSSRGAKERVWRVEHHFGYGPTSKQNQGGIFATNGVSPPGPVDLTLIDDGGIQFRHEISKPAWPTISTEGNRHYLLKMSWPLCRGDLWAALAPVMDRLIVVVSAQDLRREDAQVNSRLSWEQCAEDTICALQNDPVVRDLGRAAHVIVSFRSAGALWFERGLGGQPSTYRLLFDPTMLEGDYSLQFEGFAYGFQTCLTAGVAHHLMRRHSPPTGETMVSPFTDRVALNQALSEGIAAGLKARRRLLELGHGRVDKPHPGFPVEAIAQTIASDPGGFISVVVPPDVYQARDRQWNILSRAESSDLSDAAARTPLTGLAQLTARYGFSALSYMPSLRLGNLFTVDRSEIESFRALDALIRGYEAVKVQEKPLSIGVFGPPGAGKSFGVKALARAILGEKVPFIEFNLSQFKSPDELIGAFHRVRDAVLKGITPVAFWDEFDSQSYKWLQYLLAPMQDGTFQEGQITHPIGKCIFIFAGGTSPIIETFGVREPPEVIEETLRSLGTEERAERLRDFREKFENYRQYKLLKGPDFISRLHGFLNVLGPNPRKDPRRPDVTWPIRRAILLRGILRLKDNEEIDIDLGLLNALLCVPEYCHGARSFEKIVNALTSERYHERLHRSALPPQPLLDRETDAIAFHQLLTQGDSFKNYPELEGLAESIHYSFLAGAAKSKLDAEIAANPQVEWTIHPSIQKDYAQLTDDKKASNRAAARRIPDHLALIGFVVERQQPNDDGSWKAILAAAIGKHIERLAQAEHLGWWAERVSNGWTYAEVRDDTLKRHNLLVDWAQLSFANQQKDRDSVRLIPERLDMAKFRAVPVKSLR